MEYKFSIITVVLNAEKTIEQTILSVIEQTYPHFEYIVIDGGSTDNTLEIIKKHEHKIAYWTSGKDRGIYDAMNKGLSKVMGEIILFLNADDYFLNKDILNQVMDYFNKHNQLKLIYGKIRWQFFNPDYTMDYAGHLSLQGLKKGKMIPQASTFMKKEIFDFIGVFDTQYQISGDFDLFCRFIKTKMEYHPFELMISHFSSGGKSSNHQLAWKEGTEIIRKHFGRYYATRFALIKSFELIVKNMLTKLNLLSLFKKIRKKLIFAGKRYL